MALVAGACYGQPVYVEAQNVEPMPFGLFSVAELHGAESGHWQQGVEWEPAVCGPASIYACPTCDQNNNGTAPSKTYEEGPGTEFGAPFTVYGSFDCSPIGNWNRAEARAMQLLNNGEERAVELAMANGTFHTSKALQDATSVDITPTPGTPVTLLQGVALLESYIGANGSGQGIILGNRREVAIASAQRAIVHPMQGQTQLWTNLGTPVAAVSGWNGRTGPNNDAAGAGEAWLFALGSRPRIWRSDAFIVSDRETALDRAQNNLRILAERTYVLGWDCFTAAVLVTSV